MFWTWNFLEEFEWIKIWNEIIFTKTWMENGEWYEKWDKWKVIGICDWGIPLNPWVSVYFWILNHNKNMKVNAKIDSFKILKN